MVPFAEAVARRWPSGEKSKERMEGEPPESFAYLVAAVRVPNQHKPSRRSPASILPSGEKSMDSQRPSVIRKRFRSFPDFQAHSFTKPFSAEASR